MTRIDKGIDVTGGRSARSSFLIILGLVFVGFFIGQFVGAIASFVFAMANGMGIDEMTDDPNVLYDYMGLGEVLTTQMLYTLVFTFLTPWFYLKLIAKQPLSSISNETKLDPKLVLATIIGTFSFLFVNAYFIEWNANIEFPEFLSGFEEWARNLEEQLAETTEKFTTFNNFTQFLFGFLVIAILPGIGEELLFRGVLQNSLHKLTKNAHVAIWVSAFIFAAIHLQFYGLVPRMLLGAVFGYLYVWSGNIWYPIISHIANNGIAVIMSYTISDVNLDETEAVPVAYQIIGVVVFIAFMFLFRNYYLRPKHSLE
ncbi:CPBP family intramembrane glutamic endopeptidase [Roseivirga sp. E12]|uniref:CPBP family intramembrane glutamic endopeptidase n=1 Tax=Roseivirga sp. E12 TaxID=2819237 RepID=UPI001ABBE469|nr:CPBP family intramembrane glutamic endopeptidase [Roseivirga sp. E12]MBO3699357.1 CPBP family intramembrane metalloprotease [Roseivirga sp. E12]